MTQSDSPSLRSQFSDSLLVSVKISVDSGSMRVFADQYRRLAGYSLPVVTDGNQDNTENRKRNAGKSTETIVYLPVVCAQCAALLPVPASPPPLWQNQYRNADHRVPSPLSAALPAPPPRQHHQRAVQYRPKS